MFRKYQFEQLLAFVRGYRIIEEVNDADILVEHLMRDDQLEFPVLKSADDLRGASVAVPAEGRLFVAEEPPCEYGYAEYVL